MRILLTLIIAASLSSEVFAQAHTWSDSTGNFKVAGDLIARNDNSIVVQTREKNLLIIDISDLSKDDKKFLDSKDSKIDGLPTFTLADGFKVKGNVVEYARREVTLRGSFNRVHVNDRWFINLPEVYRRLSIAIVNHFENLDLKNEQELSEWLAKQKGRTRTYTVDGVMLELENGDRYGVPFFVFSDQDQKVLKASYEDWVNAGEDSRYRDELELELRARSREMERQNAELIRLQRLSLQLQAYRSGLLWQVEMLPPNGFRGQSMRVVVPGRNSEDAAAAAQSLYPRYRVGSIAKLRR